MEALRVPVYEKEINCPPSTFCVTGASGYVAGSIIWRLLTAGHTVHGTVRGDPLSPRFKGLLDIPGAKERLKLFQADLTQAGSFDAVITGCDYVMHVASAVTVKLPRSRVRAELVEPAVQGVENVLSAVEKTPSVRAVVLTGSLSAVYGDNWERGHDHVYTEVDWTGSASETFLPYAYSKTLSERRAWELYEAQSSGIAAPRWRLVSLLPAFVVGPPAVPGTSELVEFAVKLMSGKVWPAMPNAQFPFVDLEDVAAGHVLAALTPTAQGRIVLSHGTTTVGLFDAVHALSPRFPGRRFPIWELPKWALWVVCKLTGLFPSDLASAAVGKPVGVDGSKACRELGLVYHDPQEGLAALLERVVELGLVAPSSKK